MNATLLTAAVSTRPEVHEVEPHDPHIFLRLNPAALNSETLKTLLVVLEPTGRANAFRSWLRECVLREIGRRERNKKNECDAHSHLEAEAWALPWHTFDDAELSESLIAVWSWATMNVSEVSITSEPQAVLNEIHTAVMAACATRLREIHVAIERARKG
jgi:hypothetical protein